MIETLRSERLAMVVGKRQATGTSAFRQGHRFGNYIITRMLGVLFGTEFDDVLSGYRVFNRSFVKSFPIHARGFTIETALTVHALQLRLPCAEIDTPYHARPEGSSSKLSTWRDGLRICLYICHLFVTERPFACFGIGAGITALVALTMFVPILLSFLATGTVERVPTLIVIGSMVVAAIFAFGAGMILQAVTKARQEAKHLAYLNS
jgi:hypothetical protein